MRKMTDEQKKAFGEQFRQAVKKSVIDSINNSITRVLKEGIKKKDK